MVAAAAPAAGGLVQLVTQLTAAGVAPAVIQSVLQSQTAGPDLSAAATPPGFNRQNIVAPLLSSAVGAALPDLVAAFRGKLPETSDAPGSKAILSEDLIPRLIEQERARQRFGRFFGLDAGPSAEDVYGQIRAGRSAELEELGARERALKALEGQISAAIRQMELGAHLKRAELEVGGGIKRQELYAWRHSAATSTVRVLDSTRSVKYCYSKSDCSTEPCSEFCAAATRHPGALT